MQGDMSHGPHMFEKIKRHPVFVSLLLVSAFYLLVFIAIVIWLSINAEVTTQRRIAQSPSVTVIIKRPDTAPTPEETQDQSALPESWEQKDQALPADSATTDGSIEQDQPPAAQSTEPVTEPETFGPHAEAPAPQAAWQKLARPFNHDDPRPRIGLIVVNLGVTNNITKQAIDMLPPDVTLAFQSVSPAVTAWIEKSKTVGHENLLAIPMEPYRYPQNDPGPQTLLTILPKEDNIKRLNAALSQSANVIGIIPAQGEKFITSERSMAPVLDTIKDNGLIFVDGTLTANSAALSLTRLGRIPFIQTQNVIDASVSRQAIDLALTELENQAKQNGQAIATVLPYPATLERLESWIRTLPEKNLQLAPVSALIAVPKAPPATTPAATTTEDTTTPPANTTVPPTASVSPAPAQAGKFPDTAGPAPEVN